MKKTHADIEFTCHCQSLDHISYSPQIGVFICNSFNRLDLQENDSKKKKSLSFLIGSYKAYKNSQHSFRKRS